MGMLEKSAQACRWPCEQDQQPLLGTLLNAMNNAPWLQLLGYKQSILGVSCISSTEFPMNILTIFRLALFWILKSPIKIRYPRLSMLLH